MLLRDRAELWCPRNGGPWKAKKWWLFSPSLKLKDPTSIEDRVAHTINEGMVKFKRGVGLNAAKNDGGTTSSTAVLEP